MFCVVFGVLSILRCLRKNTKREREREREKKKKKKKKVKKRRIIVKKKKKKKKRKYITFKLQNQIQHSVGQMDSSAFVLERI
jgi:hypothetical protein